ncbi:MAG TPA: FAD-dependent oxidoreductase [Vicinamibacterales bacterium]|nr:FAD-dependent oxidoreductase [Vicinamibacterales bacterium]
MGRDHAGTPAVQRLAIVGSGIAGLAAAWLLARRYDVRLFEREPRFGGHTHTHDLETADGRLALDTGFLVHNDRAYPNLIRLFDELGVARSDTEMSFGVTCRRTGFEYSTRGVNGLFADRRNLVRPGHYRLLRDIIRFNRAARQLAGDERARARELTLEEFLDRHQLSGEVVDRFLVPLAAAIWSASPRDILSFPAITLVQFLARIGVGRALARPTWKIVRGGSATYVSRLLAPPRITARTSAPVRRVTRGTDGAGVVLTLDDGEVHADAVVFACHGDEVLPILADASPLERDVLGAFETSTNEAWLHTDSRWLPRRPAARAAWNYTLGVPGHGGATVTYHLNRLQRLDARGDYCVTLNPPGGIEPFHVLRRMVYTHPLYTRAAIGAQARWDEISGRDRVHFCGAHWFDGCHEDGLRSAVRVAAALGVPWC